MTALFSQQDQLFMQHALALAAKAELQGEVPVGAVLVMPQRMVVEGFNQPIAQHDPSAHAEIVALRQAGQQLKNYRLTGATLYVTLEPCAMCVGAMLQARIARLVYAASDPKTGACGGCFQLLENGLHHHHIQVEQGLMAAEAGALLKNFFRRRRLEQKSNGRF